MASTMKGIARRTAEGLDPSIPYILTKRRRKKKNPPIRFEENGMDLNSPLLSQIRYAVIRGIRKP
jgi:hypothetical protein